MSTTKLARQPKPAVSQPPKIGASSGASAVAVDTCDSMRAESCGPYTSRTTARPSTGPAQAPRACTRRAATRASIEVASAQAAEDSTNTAMPHSITGRRP